MIVIADTSPISYLVSISEIDILPKLYGRVLVPPSVADELRHPRAPEAVRSWIAAPPAWFEVRATSLAADEDLLQADIEIGERDAILLAQELGADELIIDDMSGRREAERRHLPVTGTVGVLRAASRLGLLDLRDAFERLRRTNFHIAESVLERLIREEKT